MAAHDSPTAQSQGLTAMSFGSSRASAQERMSKSDDDWRNPKECHLDYEEAMKLLRLQELPYLLGRESYDDIFGDHSDPCDVEDVEGLRETVRSVAVERSWQTPMEGYFDRVLTPGAVKEKPSRHCLQWAVDPPFNTVDPPVFMMARSNPVPPCLRQGPPPPATAPASMDWEEPVDERQSFSRTRSLALSASEPGLGSLPRVLEPIPVGLAEDSVIPDRTCPWSAPNSPLSKSDTFVKTARTLAAGSERSEMQTPESPAGADVAPDVVMPEDLLKATGPNMRWGVSAARPRGPLDPLLPGVPDLPGLLPRLRPESEAGAGSPSRLHATRAQRTRQFLRSPVPGQGLGGGLKEPSEVWLKRNEIKYNKRKTDAYLTKNRVLRESQADIFRQWRYMKEDPRISERLTTFTRDVPVPSLRTRPPKLPQTPSSSAAVSQAVSQTSHDGTSHASLMSPGVVSGNSRLSGSLGREVIITPATSKDAK